MGRVCTRCKEWMSDDEFHANGDGLRAQCKACRSIVTRASKYGIYGEWVTETFEAQGGRCAICGDEDSNLVIDHDHSCCAGNTACGLCVRAFICRDCNLGLGHFRDDPDRLTRAVEYLAEHQPWEGGGST